MLCVAELPDLVLLHIAEYLCHKDKALFAQTCRRIYSILPRLLFIRGHNFYAVRGRGVGDGVLEPYFDGPLLKHRVKKLTTLLKWKDQGWGNEKGQIFMKLMRGRKMVAEKRAICGTAKHEWKTAKAVLTDHAVVTMAEPGDFFRFERRVGGGGGHTLTVNDFRVEIEFSGCIDTKVLRSGLTRPVS